MKQRQEGPGAVTEEAKAKMIEILFIQYLRPSGIPRAVTTVVADDLLEKLDQIKRCGLRLAVERLSTGQVSLTIEGPLGDVGCELAENGPEVRAAVDRLIRGFDLRRVI